jgi:hypothetical protein
MLATRPYLQRFLVLFALIGGAGFPSFGQQDSVFIKGTISNLNGRLYREAPAITFSRNNILAPSSELSVNAPLEADGSFRAALPLVAPEEEIYLDYGGKVFTTFLARKGEIEIRFDADSIFKAKKLFHFAGVNADANNFYPAYLEQEAKLFEANKLLGADFQKVFWTQSLQAAKQSLLQRGILRQRALTALLAEGKQSKELTNWVNSLVEDESATLLMEYSMSNFSELSASDQMDINRFSISPLTYQKVMRANRFREYAAKNAAVKAPISRRNAGTLSVDKIAELILKQVSPISTQERDKLRLIVEKKNVDREEMDFLSKVYKKGGATLTTLVNFERSVAALREVYDGAAVEFLLSSTFVDDFFRYSLQEKKALYEHVSSGLHDRGVRLSLDELYRMEIKDSVAIQKALAASLTSKPSEIAPSIWVAEGNDNGRVWLENIQKQFLGRPLYVLNWDIYNDLNREDIESVNFLRSQLPSDVCFLYVHVSDPERAQSVDFESQAGERSLWRQYIVRHRLVGTHVFLHANQVMQLGLRSPGIPGTYYIIRPDGRYHSRNAPSPRKLEEVAAAIRASTQK